jgi:ribosome biogenesis protein Nip4
MKQTIIINESEISLSIIDENEFVSLSELSRAFGGTDEAIRNWMRTRQALEMMSIWEEENNPHFNSIEFDRIKNESGKNTFAMNPRKWIQSVKAIGIISKGGRYNNTMAHKFIALSFASWLDTRIHYQLIKAFDELHKKKTWNVIREATRRNYLFQTEAIKTHLIEPKNLPVSVAVNYYASEADMLNRIVFGITASEWRDQNLDKKGNLRDSAKEEELHLLSNLETHNAEMIEAGMAQYERETILRALFEKQLLILKNKKR